VFLENKVKKYKEGCVKKDLYFILNYLYTHGDGESEKNICKFDCNAYLYKYIYINIYIYICLVLLLYSQWDESPQSYTQGLITIKPSFIFETLEKEFQDKGSKVAGSVTDTETKTKKNHFSGIKL
jgi:hypothetical protein